MPVAYFFFSLLFALSFPNKKNVYCFSLTDCYHQNSDGETCLIVAAKLGNLRNVKTIIGYGANVRLTDTRDRTALHTAAAYGHTRIVEYLMTEKNFPIFSTNGAHHKIKNAQMTQMTVQFA
jgi:ankyrin repeat protein